MDRGAWRVWRRRSLPWTFSQGGEDTGKDTGTKDSGTNDTGTKDSAEDTNITTDPDSGTARPGWSATSASGGCATTKLSGALLSALFGLIATRRKTPHSLSGRLTHDA